MVFHWSLRDSKSPQVSRTLLSILADHNRAVVWIVFAHPLISNFCSLLMKPLETVSNAPIGISFTLMFHSFFSSPARSKYLSLFLFSLIFTLWSAGTTKSSILLVLFYFLLIITRYGLLTEIRCDLFVSQNLKAFWASHFPGQILVCAYNIW